MSKLFIIFICLVSLFTSGCAILLDEIFGSSSSSSSSYSSYDYDDYDDDDDDYYNYEPCPVPPPPARQNIYIK